MVPVGGEYSFATAPSSRSSARRVPVPLAHAQRRRGAEETSGDLSPTHLRRYQLMNVPDWVWTVTLTVTVGVLLFDVFVIGRRPHEPSRREVSVALAVYL